MGKSGCYRAKVVVFEIKMVVFWQKWLCLDKVVVFGKKCCYRLK